MQARTTPDTHSRSAEDSWYSDGGDILCRPLFVLHYLKAFDAVDASIGAEKNRLKTKLIFKVATLEEAHPEWRLDEVRQQATVNDALD